MSRRPYESIVAFYEECLKDYGTARLGPDFVLRHDYGLYEHTAYVYRRNGFGRGRR